MLGDGPLSFHEFLVGESHPLAFLHDAILEYLQGRDEVALFGAQAVNAYVTESRMTQDVDVYSTNARQTAEDIRRLLNERFHIAARIREIGDGLAYRVYQVTQPANRHLADIRQIDEPKSGSSPLSGGLSSGPF